jgi:ABC-type transport system involved in multi-copper enzyme maturation permease subunit
MSTTTFNPATAIKTDMRPPIWAGLATLVRKDLTEWLRGKRARNVALLTTLFMAGSAANARIVQFIIQNAPSEATPTSQAASYQPLDNLLLAIGTQIFVVVAIFATQSLLVGERESGTLAWTVSKPVSRTSVLVSKWLTSTLMLWLSSIVVPLAVTTALVTALYGVPEPGTIGLMAIALAAVPALYVAVALASSTVVSSQTAVAAIGFAVFLVPQLIGGLLPALMWYLPTSIFAWSIASTTSGGVSVATPIAWLVGVALLLYFSSRRIATLEL